MKQDAINKINKMGQIGQIIALIAKIFVIIGLVFLIGCSIALAALPKDFVTLNFSGGAEVSVNLNAIGITLTEEQQEEINKQGISGNNSFSSNGTRYAVDKLQAQDSELFIQASADNVSVSLSNFVWIMISAVLTLAMTLVTLFFIGGLCKAIRYCQTPFEENVICKMRYFAFSLIPWVILSTVSQSVASGILNNHFQIGVSIDFGMIIIVLVVLALTYIFRYGAVLQQESDETL